MLGSSLALLALPPFIEQQRMELEDMQNMQKKQVCIYLFDELLVPIKTPPTLSPPFWKFNL